MSGRIEIITGPMFSGKCLGIDTKVLLYEGGVKKVQDVVKGDFLMGDDSKPRKVLSITSGYGQLFKVKQTNGIDYIVNKDHILSLKHRFYIKNVIDINVKEYINSSEKIKSNFKGYKIIPEYIYKELDKPPYELGCKWRGDNDYIPDTIKYNLLRIREEFIVGHLETYGEYHNSSFYLNIENWCNDNINEYTRLLSLCGLVVEKNRYELKIYGNLLHELGWTKYKSNIDKPLRYETNENLSNISIVSIGYGNYYGFTLDGNHRFALEDGTVTHNTSELLGRLNRDVYAKRKILYINHSLDNRSDTIYSTHNPLLKGNIFNYDMKSCSSLPSLEEVAEYDTIGIDEAQFFDNLDMTDLYANSGKRVIVSGLIGDSNRKKFGHISDILPFAEQCDILNAVCVKCAENKNHTNASFTIKISDSTVKDSQVDIGADDKYIPVCRYHFDN